MEKTNAFQSQLLNWYKREARDLPWRIDSNPYNIWLSEIMLQQTRVDTVIPYFNRFIAEIPNLEALASIDDDRLLKLWQGLGYYSRAVNLKRAALMIIKNHNGQFPSNMEDLTSLPGVGTYTAGAILSIAFERPVVAVDGNVLRILARTNAINEDINNTKTKKILLTLANELMPSENTGDYNQALMDLGATVCLPNGKPKCRECPVNNLCEAYKYDLVDQIPIKIPKKNREIVKKTIFIIYNGDRFAIRKRKPGSLLPNLWEFPNIDGHLTEVNCRQALEDMGMSILEMRPLEKSKHLFTHLEWHLIGYFAYVENKKNSEELVWASKNELISKYSIPTAFKAYLNYAYQFSETSELYHCKLLNNGDVHE